jgi:hypothetical protein
MFSISSTGKRWRRSRCDHATPLLRVPPLRLLNTWMCKTYSKDGETEGIEGREG